jgi:hypoxanthine phosphoribosyltransferase
MKEIIQILDKEFEMFIKNAEIKLRIQEIAEAINQDYRNKKPVFLAILNGSFFFASDLLQEIKVLCEISFIKLNSYKGTGSSGKVNTLIGLEHSLEGRDLIILEDIIDSGLTMKTLLAELEKHKPQSVGIASMLYKQKALKENIRPDYTGFRVPEYFLLGYGLDYNGYGRNLKDIYKIRARDKEKIEKI